MSVKTMGLVWDTDLKPTLRFVLLAYADHADHEGKSIFPSIKLVSNKTGFSRRTIQTSTRELEQMGYLIPDGQSPTGTNRWKIPLDMGGAGDAPPTDGVQENARGGAGNSRGGVQLTAQRGAGDAPESLKNHKGKPSIKKRDRPPAVELCKRIIFRYPHKSIWKTIDHQVGSEFISLLKWGRILRIWKLSGYNITNYKGMLNVFKEGWRAKKEKKKSGFELVKEMLQDGKQPADHGDSSPTDSNFPQLEA